VLVCRRAGQRRPRHFGGSEAPVRPQGLSAHAGFRPVLQLVRGLRGDRLALERGEQFLFLNGVFIHA